MVIGSSGHLARRNLTGGPSSHSLTGNLHFLSPLTEALLPNSTRQAVTYYLCSYSTMSSLHSVHLAPTLRRSSLASQSSSSQYTLVPSWLSFTVGRFGHLLRRLQQRELLANFICTSLFIRNTDSTKKKKKTITIIKKRIKTSTS